MNASDIKKIIEQVAEGTISVDGALDSLREMPYSDIEIAKHDFHRPLRNGFSEVIFCEGKQPEHVFKIVESVSEKGSNLLATRADSSLLSEIAQRFPRATIDQRSRTFSIISRGIEKLSGRLAVVCAGTADIAVAEEAAKTAEFFGSEPSRFYDVGVAGLHRLLKSIPSIRELDCVIVVAGMEGALPSVLGGLVDAPVIAVPTSIGYGASFGGVTALLSMLNSCSEGISVMNIDNGFGAACAALRILRKLQSE